MKIAGLQKLSTIDYPEVLSAVVFTNGCNYNCWYCHNRELISGDAVNIDYDYVIDFFVKRKDVLQGVVISGGEPTIQPDLLPFILLLKSIGYQIKLDTNGSNPDVLYSVLKYLDYVAIDYKAVKNLYSTICGKADYSAIAKSLSILGESNIKWEIRTTITPELAELITDIKQELSVLSFKNKPMQHRLNRYIPPKIIGV